MGVVTVTAGGGLTGTVGAEGTAGTEATTPLTVSVGEVATVEMMDVAPAGWAGSEPPLWDGRSVVGALPSAPCPRAARDGCRKTPPSTERFCATDAGCRRTLGAKGRA